MKNRTKSKKTLSSTLSSTRLDCCLQIRLHLSMIHEATPKERTKRMGEKEMRRFLQKGLSRFMESFLKKMFFMTFFSFSLVASQPRREGRRTRCDRPGAEEAQGVLKVGAEHTRETYLLARNFQPSLGCHQSNFPASSLQRGADLTPKWQFWDEFVKVEKTSNNIGWKLLVSNVSHDYEPQLCFILSLPFQKKFLLVLFFRMGRISDGNSFGRLPHPLVDHRSSILGILGPKGTVSFKERFSTPIGPESR